MAKLFLKKGKSLRNISNPNLFLFSLKYIDLQTWKIKTGDIKYVSAQKLYLDKESNRPDIVLKEVDNFFEQVLLYFFPNVRWVHIKACEEEGTIQSYVISKDGMIQIL